MGKLPKTPSRVLRDIPNVGGHVPPTLKTAPAFEAHKISFWLKTRLCPIQATAFMGCLPLPTAGRWIAAIDVHEIEQAHSSIAPASPKKNLCTKENSVRLFLFPTKIAGALEEKKNGLEANMFLHACLSFPTAFRHSSPIVGGDLFPWVQFPRHRQHWYRPLQTYSKQNSVSHLPILHAASGCSTGGRSSRKKEKQCLDSIKRVLFRKQIRGFALLKKT